MTASNTCISLVGRWRSVWALVLKRLEEELQPFCFKYYVRRIIFSDPVIVDNPPTYNLSTQVASRALDAEPTNSRLKTVK